MHVTAGIFCACAFFTATAALGQARDPGVRQGANVGAPPQPLTGTASTDMPYFDDGMVRFQTVEVVSGATTGQGNGLGPRFNSNQCSSCHQFPAVGGSSPPVNPLPAVAAADGAANQLPWFIASGGPIREARFKTSNGAPDGGVHDLFVVTGRRDVPSGCTLTQPSFAPAGNPITGQGGNSNIVFRIPTPLFGAGLIEAIPDSAILANLAANHAAKAAAGVQGHPNAIQGGNVNRSGNDGTITRFGWKAQNKSLLMFSGEAYNVEMGISNQLFPQEREEAPGCQGNAAPNDTSNFNASSSQGLLSDIEAFSDFMRMLAPPAPATPTASTLRGSALFSSTGCALCHTPTLATGAAIAASGGGTSRTLSHQQVNLFSDLLVHHMGAGLADGITQGAAGPDEFRSAPLWGLGQRVFFLHDGRTTDLVQAIHDHASSGSEANTAVQSYASLSAQQQQDVLNFLRSL
jgi:CxxC motif-containing protein (DUF1111 family)